MAAVPDRVLNWLYSVLTNEYHDVNRTYSDVAESLSHYPSLRPRTEVYTYENGTSALLLHVSGTLPVVFRGVVYRFPIALWVPHAYPRESPIVYVTPAADMVIRAGQHVSGDGRIYHPYLAQWDRYWDKSTILDFLEVLRGVFSKEPPVMSKQQAQHGLPRTEEARPPPPVPPPPEEWRRSVQQSPISSASPIANRPPPPPPKPGQQGPGASVTQVSRQDGGPAPPPVPPHPGYRSGSYVQPGNREHALETQPQPQIPGAWEKPMPPLPPEAQGGNFSRPVQAPQYSNSPVSPLTPDGQQRPLPYQHQQHAAPQAPVAYPPRDPNTYGPPSQQQFPSRQPPPNQYPQQPGYTPSQVPQPPPPQQNLQPPKPKEPVPDILSSPLDVTIPSQSGPLPNIPAPPIPPNPEKDALLKALSSTLISQLGQTVASNQSALGPLQAQQVALRQAHARLQAELDQLQQLDAALASNESILVSSMHEADRVIEESKTRQVPDVDDVLVAPTVVGNQLYTLCAEERAVGDAMFVLGRGLDKGRIGFDVFVKQTRSLAREQFLKKALIKKIARGMGLDEFDYNR